MNSMVEEINKMAKVTVTQPTVWDTIQICIGINLTDKKTNLMVSIHEFKDTCSPKYVILLYNTVNIEARRCANMKMTSQYFIIFCRVYLVDKISTILKTCSRDLEISITDTTTGVVTIGNANEFFNLYF
jgi:hypothetical protein